MFFTLSPTIDSRFPNHTVLGGMMLSHDAGWDNSKLNTVTKGYNHKTIGHGNFVEISMIDNLICVDGGNARSFPLYWNNETLTLSNLDQSGVRIFADRIPMIGKNSEFVYRDIIGNIDISEITAEHAVTLIVDNLCTKSQALVKEYPKLPRRLFVTGGIDTVTLFALMRNQGIDFELLDYNHFEFDDFLNSRYPTIREQYWAYQRIHHWKESCILLTGGNGDESLMRGPVTIAIWAAWHNIDIRNIIKTGYHSNYFSKPSNCKLFDSQDPNLVKLRYPNKEDLIKDIVNINLNDHQYWHLGNTLTWTPFVDQELTKIMLRLNTSDIISQIVDATISRQVIEKLYPPALDLISDLKNVNTRNKLHLLGSI